MQEVTWLASQEHKGWVLQCPRATSKGHKQHGTEKMTNKIQFLTITFRTNFPILFMILSSWLKIINEKYNTALSVQCKYNTDKSIAKYHTYHSKFLLKNLCLHLLPDWKWQNDCLIHTYQHRNISILFFYKASFCFQRYSLYFTCEYSIVNIHLNYPDFLNMSIF